MQFLAVSPPAIDRPLDRVHGELKAFRPAADDLAGRHFVVAAVGAGQAAVFHAIGCQAATLRAEEVDYLIQFFNSRGRFEDGDTGNARFRWDVSGWRKSCHTVDYMKNNSKMTKSSCQSEYGHASHVLHCSGP